MTGGVAGVLGVVLPLAGALLLLDRPSPRLGDGGSSDAVVVAGPGPATGLGPEPPAGLLRRARPLWSALAGAGAAALVGGPIALPAALLAAVATWIAAGRIEPPAVRRRRHEVRRDLPHVVGLLATALRSGLDPAAAIDLVCRALPGPAAARLASTAARLRLGGDVAAIWSALGHDPELAPLGRALARAHRTGAPVAAAIERLAADLAADARSEAEDRARAIGVRAAIPLGLCLLPAFLLLGIVPLAVALAATIV